MNEPGQPCDSCGVRGDVSCKHRPGLGAPPPAIANPNSKGKDGRKPSVGQGWNAFHRPSQREMSDFIRNEQRRK